MMKGLYRYYSLLLLHQHFMAGMDSVVHGMVTVVLGTGTDADRGMGLAAVAGMDSVVAPGMADLGGNIALISESSLFIRGFLQFRQEISSIITKN
jgi:hypothetical protein